MWSLFVCACMHACMRVEAGEHLTGVCLPVPLVITGTELGAQPVRLLLLSLWALLAGTEIYHCVWHEVTSMLSAFTLLPLLSAASVVCPCSFQFFVAMRALPVFLTQLDDVWWSLAPVKASHWFWEISKVSTMCFYLILLAPRFVCFCFDFALFQAFFAEHHRCSLLKF